MNQIPPEYFKEISSKIALTNNLTNWSYTIENFEVIAQNYFGVLVPIVIQGQHVGRNESVILKIVVKLAPTDERFRVSGALTLMFAREIFVYSVLLKEYNKLQINLKEDNRFISPNCFYVRDEYCNEALAIEDMREKRYKPYTKNMFLDLEHITISIQSLAKFHALSFLLKLKNKDLYETVSNKCIPLNETTNKRFMVILDDRLEKAMGIFKNTKYTELLQKCKDNCNEYIGATSKNVNELCLCHGDIWKDNIMFCYEGTQPITACIIDYQTVRMSSPAYDLLYLITSSTDTKLRRDHYLNLIDEYYNVLRDFLSEAGVNADEIYSKEKLVEDLKVVSPACFIIANTALWLSCGLQQEGHVRSKKVLKTDAERDEAANLYRGIVEGIITDYQSFGYFEAC